MAAHFAIDIREQVTTLYAPSVEAVWEEYVGGFGPVAAINAALDAEGRRGFQAAFEDLHRPYETGLGLAIPRLALVIRAVRK